MDKEFLSNLPNTPGIYLYYNDSEELIYVGKATSLKNRVKSYFVGKSGERPIEQFIGEVNEIRTIETDSVLEAIILEAEYIRKFQPKYNVLGKDNKSWNYITISKDEYPVVKTMREHDLRKLTPKESKAKFKYIFGPYPGLNSKATMKILRKLFTISTCQTRKSKQYKDKPCLYYQMGKCLGVCTKEITPELYKEKVINPLKMFLRGHKKRLVKQIEKDMLIAAKEEQFEEAARLRDQLKQLQKIQDMTLINQSFFDYNIGARTNEIVKVEAYDISNLGATGKVGSMVVSMYGEPDKSQYRKFKIRGVDGQSDVDCMEEVIRRRLKHHEWRFPELFLIDGGKPQVNRVQKIFDELDINIPIVGIAKGPDRKKDEFTFSNKRTRDLTKWIQSHQEELIKLRDEAHRFAITYQRKLRKLKK